MENSRSPGPPSFPQQGTDREAAPEMSPAAFLLELRRRRVELAEALRVSKPIETPAGPAHPVATAPNSGNSSGSLDGASLLRWMQRIDDKLGHFDQRLERIEASAPDNATGAAQDTIRRLSVELHRQRVAQYHMMNSSEAIVSRLMTENSDLQDYINSLESNQSSGFPSKRRKLGGADNQSQSPAQSNNDAMDITPDQQAHQLMPPPPPREPSPYVVSYPSGYDPRLRRFSVSNESYSPEALSQVKTKAIPKTEECRNRLRATISSNSLFRHLRREEIDEVISAMWEVRSRAGDTIMKEGDDGDNMYVIESGELDVLYSDEIVAVLGPGRSFGEQALMYNSGRNATIRAKTDCVLWAVDRGTFRRILMQESLKRRALYESFLTKVPLFEKLLPYERAKIADALEPVNFEEGHVIVHQGEDASVNDNFYIIEKGFVKCTKQDPNDGSSKPLMAMRLGRGDYFGELALLLNQPRQATVTAAGGPVKCLAISKKHFAEVMGPVKNFLSNRMHLYASYQELRDKAQTDNNSNLSGSNESLSRSHGSISESSLSASSGLDVQTMLAKETEYCASLERLVTIYMSSLQEKLQELKVSQQEFDVIFSNVPELLARSRHICADQGGPKAPNTLDFLKYIVEALPLYSKFIKSYYASMVMRRRKRTVPSFASWVDSCDARAQSDLSKLIALPAKRLTEYAQFALGVQQSELADGSKQVAKQIQSSLAELEKVRLNSEKVYNIHQNIVGDVDIATDPARQFVAEGEMTKLDSGENLVAFLFSDLLVLTRPVPVGGGKIRATHFMSIPLDSVKELLPRGDFAGRLIFSQNGVDHSLEYRSPQSQWLQALYDAVSSRHATDNKGSS